MIHNTTFNKTDKEVNVAKNIVYTVAGVIVGAVLFTLPSQHNLDRLEQGVQSLTEMSEIITETNLSTQEENLGL